MSSSKPAAVVFDLGKVLLDFDYSHVVRKVAALGRVDVDTIHRLLLSSTLLPAFECGDMSPREFYRQICEGTGFTGDYEQFVRYFSDIFSEIPAMVALQAELRSRGVPTFIFSNTNELAIAYVRQAFPFFARFDGYVLSYEHHSMKPDAPLYEVVERVTGRRGADLLYFDDRLENIEAGLGRGWQAVLHVDPVESRKALERSGLLG